MFKMAATKGYYRRWYGNTTDLNELTIGHPSEDTNKTAILRVTDNYYDTQAKKVYWWDGSTWNLI